MFKKNETYAETFIDNFLESFTKTHYGSSFETQGLKRVGYTIRITYNDSVMILVAIDYADEFLFECVYLSEDFVEQIQFDLLIRNNKLLQFVENVKNFNVIATITSSYVSKQILSGAIVLDPYILNIYGEDYYYLNEDERDFDIAILSFLFVNSTLTLKI